MTDASRTLARFWAAGPKAAVVLLLSGCEVMARLSGEREMGLLDSSTNSSCSGTTGLPSRGAACGGTGGTPTTGAGPTTGGNTSMAGGPDSEFAGTAVAGHTADEPGGSGGEGGAPSAPVPLPARSCEGDAVDSELDGACVSLRVRGGKFAMGRGDDGPDAYLGDSNEQPEHSVVVSPFWLDKYEVTVGRFRRFFASYDNPGSKPPLDSGAHPKVPLSGWKKDWDALLPVDQHALSLSLVASDPDCNTTLRTWTPAASRNERLPINCIDWYLSYAFCIWDGGRLPTEAEWEFAAAGGSENRLFPWGPDDPDQEHAVFGCLGSGTADCAAGDIRPVGSAPKGIGLFGQLDLAGSMLERTRDVFDPDSYSPPLTMPNATDVIYLNFDADHHDSPARGGSFAAAAGALRSAFREDVFRDHRWDGVGFRCARDP